MASFNLNNMSNTFENAGIKLSGAFARKPETGWRVHLTHNGNSIIKMRPETATKLGGFLNRFSK